MPAKLITSPHNPRVKAAFRLRNGRQRQKQERIVIDGGREIARALAADVRLVEVFHCPALAQSEACRAALALATRARVEVLEVTPQLFARLAYGERAEGLVAVAETPRRSLTQLSLAEHPLVAVLEGVEKPGNMGAVLRSADAAGVSAVVVAGGRTDLYNPNVIRASLGTIFTLPVCEATAAETLAWLETNGLAIFAARVEGAVPYTSADFTGPAAIVLGSEASGLSALWTNAGGGAAATAISLPMLGAADSLNLSTAAAVLFYEALRQRQAQSAK
jgi:TrmH family RNA methyltransferase